MDHTDHGFLLRDAATGGGRWANLGSSQSAFTLALAELVGSGSEIYTIDKEAGALDRQEAAMSARFPRVAATCLDVDFSQRLALPPLDGVLMANSLHFIRHKEPLVQLLKTCLKPGGKIDLVEYNTDAGNQSCDIARRQKYPTRNVEQ